MSLKFLFFSEKCKIIYGDRKHTSALEDRRRLGGAGGRRKEIQSGMKKLLGVINMFVILIIMIVPCLYTYVKTYQIIL